MKKLNNTVIKICKCFGNRHTEFMGTQLTCKVCLRPIFQMDAK